MRKTNFFYVLPIIMACYAFVLLEKTAWNVKIKEAKINFELPSEPHRLSFSGIDATINFDAKDLSSSEVIARVDVKSLQTEDTGLTRHLLTADFFGADKFPWIKFISSRIVKADTGFITYGALALKDSVHAVSIPFKFEQKGEEGIFRGTFSIFSGDYGVMKKSKTGKDKVNISLEIPVSRSK